MWEISDYGSLLFVVCVISIGFIFGFQDFMIFLPTHSQPRLEQGYEWWFVDKELYGVKKEPEPGHNLWFMCHANAGQASWRIQYLGQHLPAGDGLYILEYPGYGQREGRRSMDSINLAAMNAYKFLVSQVQARKRFSAVDKNMKIGVIGESLGTGPAAFLTSFKEPDHLILVAPYDSLSSVVSSAFYIPSFLARLLLLHNWDNIQSLQRYTGKVTIYYAKNDLVIPPAHAFNLFLSMKMAKETNFIATHLGHNGVYWSPLFRLCF
jgi:uncharacterized protein